MYAIIETGGKQIKVSVGDKIFVERLPGEANDQVTFDKVLLVSDKSIKVGKPYLEGAKVTGKIAKQGLGRKLRVFKYKAKTNEHKTIGHRQPYSCVVIEAING